MFGSLMVSFVQYFQNFKVVRLINSNNDILENEEKKLTSFWKFWTIIVFMYLSVFTSCMVFLTELN